MNALHAAAIRGSVEHVLTILSSSSGADIDARAPNGCTPLHMAAVEGHWKVVEVLVKAGANPNNREWEGGATPLCFAADKGHLAATRVLIRARADPLLTYTGSSGVPILPLDAAACGGHSEVARELIREYGIGGCGGESGGVHALQVAAESQQVEVMGMLATCGVVDTGVALIAAAALGNELPVKILLQRQEWKAGYPDSTNASGATPLAGAIQSRRPCSSRISRLLVDEGADTTTALHLTDDDGRVVFNDTPLAFVDYCSSDTDDTESQRHSLEATRRLLSRVEAVHAVSWLWARDTPSSTRAATEGTSSATPTTPSTLLPVLKRTTGRPRVLLSALSRWVVM